MKSTKIFHLENLYVYTVTSARSRYSHSAVTLVEHSAVQEVTLLERSATIKSPFS